MIFLIPAVVIFILLLIIEITYNLTSYPQILNNVFTDGFAGGYSEKKFDREIDDHIKRILPLDLPTKVKIDDIDRTLKYRSGVLARPVLHIGQRKLFLNELQFLTNILPSKTSEGIVVYAGAAPSNHIWILHELFPNIKFVLVDPNEFFIYINGRKSSHYTAKQEEIVYLKSGTADMYSQKSRVIDQYDGERIVQIDKLSLIHI